LRNQTTKKEFSIFERVFQKYIKIFGFEHFDVTIKHIKIISDNEDEQIQACTDIDTDNCRIEASLNIDRIVDSPIEMIAKHEAEHVLVAPLYNLASERFVSKKRLEDTEEDLVKKLEHLLK